jgi:hypothetical protein
MNPKKKRVKSEQRKGEQMKAERKLLIEAISWIEFLLPYAIIGVDEYGGPELSYDAVQIELDEWDESEGKKIRDFIKKAKQISK